MVHGQFSANFVEKLCKRLDELASKPKTFTLQDMITRFEKDGKISAVLEAGYSFADIADLLKSSDIKVSASTLRSYYRKAVKLNKEQEQEQVEVEATHAPVVIKPDVVATSVAAKPSRVKASKTTTKKQKATKVLNAQECIA